MGKACKIIRSSINAFFHSYHSLASIATFLVFPVSTSILLSQAATPASPILRTISSRLSTLLHAAGLPASSQFFSFLNLKLSQTILSFFSTLPFTLTFLIIAKISILHIIHHRQCRTPITLPFSSLIRLYRSLLLTHLFNSFTILSANAAVFSLLFLVFNALDAFHLSSENSILVLSAAGAVLYSIVLTNTMVACNLAIIVSAMENCSGCLAFLKACVLIRGREATAIILALPVNLGMAATEALFQYRVVRQYRGPSKLRPPIILEAFSIGYMYSLLLVLDVVVSCKLFESCRSSWESECNDMIELEPEEKGALQA